MTPRNAILEALIHNCKFPESFKKMQGIFQKDPTARAGCSIFSFFDSSLSEYSDVSKFIAQEELQKFLDEYGPSSVDGKAITVLDFYV